MKLFNNIFTSKTESELNQNSSDVNDVPKLEEFDVNDFPESYRSNPFYFYKYCRMDGEWINEGEKICIIRINEFDNYRFQSAIISASKGGVLEWILEENQALEQKMIFYKLHDKGVYNNENSITKSEYKHFFYIDEPKHTFETWLKSDGTYVIKGEDIYQFKLLKDIIKTVKAEKDGFLHIANDKVYNLEKGQLMYYIRDNDEIRIEQKFINIPKIIIDEFNDSKKIEWSRVSTKYIASQGIVTKSDDFTLDLTLCLNFIEVNDFIVFHFNPKQVKVRSNDKINFLFENGEKIEFIISNPITSKNIRNEKIIECKSLITKSELDLLANSNLKKWKITLKNDDREILGGNISGDDNYRLSDLKIAIKKYSREYIKIVNEVISNYQPLEIRNSITDNDKTKDNYCSVYLMHDTANGFYKIGISNKPEYRERTLQSEKPSIEMIQSKNFPIRKIAEIFEKSLHEAYSDKRIRGEWFQLNLKDVQDIKESLE